MTDIRLLYGTTLIELHGWLLQQNARLTERFEGPSALAEFSVRGLAGHLRRAMTMVEAYLDQPALAGDGAADVETVSAAAYFASVLPADEDLDSDFHRAIRQRGIETAPDRPDDFSLVWAESAGNLITRLEQEPADRLVQVFGGVVLTLDEYLATRLVELVVHDDLAVSLDVAPALLSPDVTGLVITTLVEVARLRHGDSAVVRALCRRERDSADALRVI